jgi:GT2 family glycosyltransferase
MQNKILVIIVSYNFAQWIDRCLGSLRLSDAPVDVIVVDNNSADDTVERIKRDYPEVMLVCSNRNLGFGQANNIGMRYAVEHNYDFVFLLNQDAWVDSNTISTLADCCRSDSSVGIISPIHMNGAGSSMDFGFAGYVGTDDISRIPADRIIETPFVNAAFWMIPVSVLRVVGGFSPVFFHYGEDVDYVNRIHKHGYKLAYTSVRGYHDREKRETTRPKQVRLDTVYMLVVAADVNRSLPESLARSIGGSAKFVLTSLMRRRWREVVAYQKANVKLTINLGKIIKARRQACKRDASFLHVKP